MFESEMVGYTLVLLYGCAFDADVPTACPFLLVSRPLDAIACDE